MRNIYDLSHLAHVSGDIGRIQTLTVMPIEAGASIELHLDGLARLAPNRKEIVSDCQWDIISFFVPHRIVFGQQWIDFINSGPDATNTFTGYAIAADYRNPVYLGLPTCGASLNKSLVQGYNRIYYNYFAVPSYTLNPDNLSATNNFDWYPTNEPGADRCRLYGRLAARLPHVLNGGTMVNAAGTSGWEAQDLTDADQEVPIDTGTGTFNLRDLAAIQSRYKSEAQSAWFSHFYQDVMREKWGTKVSSDADPSNLRPQMLMRNTGMLSGHDIDGTDDATLGTFQGKSMDRIQFHMPRKYFAEHGNLWVMALLRYPLVHTREAHPLLQTIDWTYDDISGDAERYANLAPVAYDPGPWLAGGVTFTPQYQFLQQPYGQHYRFQNNRVHPNFQAIPGYPFSNWNGDSPKDWLYYQNNEYRDTFQTTQIGQWQIQSLVKATKYSNIPGVSASIFAGT